MLLHENHPFSAGKGSKYVNTHYFFLVDKVDKKEIKIVYCPTTMMISDYSTKLIQGKVFATHCNIIAGVLPENFNLHESYNEETLK